VAFNDSSRRPRLVEGIELRLLPLSPQEAFVLSRIDGSVTESELVMLTGLDAEVVREALTRLASLGALSFVEPSRAGSGAVANALGQSGVRISRPSGTLRIGPIVEVRAGEDPHHPAAALYDPAELDEAVELDTARKRRVLDVFYRLDTLTHYELLAVPAQADKKAIKAAYYELVNVFHPDRYYGKNLGSFKHKLERVFARITEAHDVLTRSQAREEYDLYLKAQERTRALDQSLQDVQGSALEVERIEREIREQARAVEHAQSQYPPVEAPVRASVSPAGPSSAPIQPRPSDPESRRRALARKLGMSVPPGRSSSVSGERPAVSSSDRPSDRGAISTRGAHEAAADDLKRRYEQRVNELKRRQIDQYVQSAERSLLGKDLISAANALKIAVSLAPGDVRLRERLDEVQLQAAVTLAASYLEQAQYEEREGRFAEAARSYERVARAKASPKVFERTAYCLLSARGDLKQAAEWGKKAVHTAPEDASFRVTLARIYLEAGLRQSAVAEFERAATLSPKDDTIKDWLRKARRTDG
jgi:curved DNA-binding protein CbpA